MTVAPSRLGHQDEALTRLTGPGVPPATLVRVPKPAHGGFAARWTTRRPDAGWSRPAPTSEWRERETKV